MADQPAAAPPPPEGFVPVAAPGSPPPPPPGFVPVTPPPAPGLLESFGRGAAEGATFGTDRHLGMDRERREASRRTNPWTHFAGEILGGIGPMVAATLLPTGVGQVAAAGRAAQLASRGAGLVRSALVPGEITSAGQAALQGAKLGTTYGALSGAGHAENAGDVIPDAFRGAATGAVLGAPLGLAGHGAYRGAQYMGNLYNRATAETATIAGQPVGPGALNTAVRGLERDNMSPQTIIDNILADFPSATNPTNQASRFWGNATGGNRQPWTQEQVLDLVKLAAQDKTPTEISAALRAANNGVGPGQGAVRTLLTELENRHLGPLNMLDRASMVRPGAGDNTQMNMRAAAATSGEARGIAREGLLERQVGANPRLTDAMGRVIGTTDFAGTEAAHNATLQNAAQRAYGLAFQTEQPFNLAPIFQRWEQQFDKMRGIVPDGIRARLNSMMWRETTANGQTVRIPPQDLQGFMYAREGLRDLIDELPKGNNLRRHLTKFSNEITEEVGTHNPNWVTANQLYRDGIAGREALEAGANMSTRINSASRENLAVLTDAQQSAVSANEALTRARSTITGAKSRAPTANELAAAKPEQRLALDAAEARLEAANARIELFQVGLVRALTDKMANQGETHNLTRELLLPSARKMLQQVLGDDKAEQLLRVIRAEAAMHRTYQSQFGSQTTPLREAVDELSWAPRFEVSALNPLTWPNAALNLAQEYAARTINARRNTDLMRLYTETDPVKQLELLRRMQTLHGHRSTAGNIAGIPITGSAGVTANLRAGENAAQNQPLPAPIPVRRP